MLSCDLHPVAHALGNVAGVVVSLWLFFSAILRFSVRSQHFALLFEINTGRCGAQVVMALGFDIQLLCRGLDGRPPCQGLWNFQA